MINIGLNDMRIPEFARSTKSSFHSVAQVNSDHFTRAPVCSQLRMPAFSATAFQHHFALKKIGSNRCDPGQELIGVKVIALNEVLPLPTKVFGGGCLIGLNFFRHSKPGDSTNNSKTTRAGLASQFAFHDLDAFLTCDGREQYCTTTHRT